VYQNDVLKDRFSKAVVPAMTKESSSAHDPLAERILKSRRIPFHPGRTRRFRVRPFRTQRKNINLIHLLPNVLTSFNVACGVSAILFATEGRFEIAAQMILLAGFFDLIDGKVARLVGSSSQFGTQLDSLADVISFGAAPPLLYHAMLYPTGPNRLSVAMVLIYTLCTALRLARYNVQASGGQKRTHFTGLPCPAPAGFLAALVLISYEYNFLLVPPVNPVVNIGIHILLVSLAGMMVSTITFPDFSTIHVEKKNVYQYNVIIVLILCVAVLRFKEVFTILVGTYIMAGPVITIREYSRRRAEHAAGLEPSPAKNPETPVENP